MKNIITKATAALLFVCVVLLCSCADNTSKITEAIENRNADELVSIINAELEGNKDVDKMNETIDSCMRELAETDDYENFVFMEKVRDGIPDSSTKDCINKVLDDNGKNKVMSYLKGTWIRKDGTDMDGACGEITWNEGTGVLILNSVDDAINPESFNDNDLKWNNVSVIDATTIKGEDLSKADGVGEYTAFIGTIDYADNMVFIQTVDSSTDYAKGNNQTWILKDYYDSFDGKQVLTDDDFKASGEGIDENTIINDLKEMVYYYYFYNPEVDKSEEGVITTNRGIHLGSDKAEVIDKYGIGSYAAFDKDADLIRFSNRGIPDQLKNAKYALQYRVKDKKGKRIYFYFNDEDKVITIFYARTDYSSMLKEMQ